jgi:hypothetical protein
MIKIILNKMSLFSFFIILLTIILLILTIRNYNKEGLTNNDNLTVVSGYWNVTNKYSNGKYNEWFKNTLKINQKYIFYCNKTVFLLFTH